MEVDDRVSALEQRLQLQEDELAVLKAALADALRRLRVCEEQGATLRARGTPKGRAPPRLGTTASGILSRLKGERGRGRAPDLALTLLRPLTPSFQCVTS
ncbi:echinoderm microtubule-associated protein-like 1 [Trichechus manatus latirostris]|uniref:Echinoderm microtubule-associated protein-like 1 n=1 Tax=Trichechus manatus latirostris TaxID=127582 RepID=A0A2Y9RKD4_TRIMA|nr:echinoderm microtubule-associated protein-like 1 [Trichechus manatus latirostris]